MAFFCASSAHLPHIFCGVAEGSDSWRLGLRKGEGSCRRGCLEEPCVQEGVDRRNLHVFCRLFPGIQDRQPGCPRPLWAVLKKGWRLSPGGTRREDASGRQPPEKQQPENIADNIFRKGSGVPRERVLGKAFAKRVRNIPQGPLR